MTLTCTGWVFIYAQLTCVSVDGPPPAVCPPVPTWSREFQQRVAAEMQASPNSALAEVAIQAIRSRDVARACARKRKAS